VLAKLGVTLCRCLKCLHGLPALPASEPGVPGAMKNIATQVFYP
jgi:hypothetical protein